MKSTKVQTLGAVALNATTACTDDASIAGFGPLHLDIVSRWCMLQVLNMHAYMCIHKSNTVEPPITDSPFNGTLYKAGGTFGTDRQPTMSRTFSTP